MTVSWRQLVIAGLVLGSISCSNRGGGIPATLSHLTRFEEAQQTLLFFHMYADGRLVSFAPDNQQVRTSPKWHRKVAPPLSVAAAVSIGCKEVDKHYPDSTETQIKAISIRPVPSRTMRDRWYFVLEFYVSSDEGRAEKVESVPVVILMTGDVVDPVLCTNSSVDK